MSKEIKEVILLNGEQIQQTLEGDAYNQSANIFDRLKAYLIKLFGKALGIKLRQYIVQTNKRLIIVEKGVFFWIFPTTVRVYTLSFQSIDHIGYAQKNSFLVFKSLYFVMALRGGGMKEIKYEGKLNDLNTMIQSMIDTVYA